MGTHTVGGGSNNSGNNGGNNGGGNSNPTIDLGDISITTDVGGVKLDWPGYHMDDSRWTNYKIYMDNYVWVRHWIVDNSVILNGLDVDEGTEFVVVAYAFNDGNARLGEFRGVYDPSGTYNLTLDTTSSTAADVQEVFPNPSTDFVNISGVTGDVNGSIYTVDGSLVKTFDTTRGYF